MMRQAGRYMKARRARLKHARYPTDGLRRTSTLVIALQVYQDLCKKHPTFRERSENADLAVSLSYAYSSSLPATICCSSACCYLFATITANHTWRLHHHRLGARSSLPARSSMTAVMTQMQLCLPNCHSYYAHGLRCPLGWHRSVFPKLSLLR